MVAGRSAAKKKAADADDPAQHEQGSADDVSTRESPDSSGAGARRTEVTGAALPGEEDARTAAKTTTATGEKTGRTGKTPRTSAKTTGTKKAARPSAKRSTTKRSTAKQTATEQSSTKKTAKRATAKRAEAQQTGARTVAAKKTTTQEPSAVPQARAAAVAPGDLAVRSGEEPWTVEEVEEARAELQDEAALRREEITASEEALTGLMRDSGDGAGDDQADTGSKNITREHQLALAGNARDMLYQTERALERMDAGTYGLCESCGNAIGKARMQAFPRATLCVECKQRQERR